MDNKQAVPPQACLLRERMRSLARRRRAGRVHQLQAHIRVTEEELRHLREEAAAAEAEARKASKLAHDALGRSSFLGVVMLVLAVLAAIGGLALRSGGGESAGGESEDGISAADVYCRSAVHRLRSELETLTSRVDALE